MSHVAAPRSRAWLGARAAAAAELALIAPLLSLMLIVLVDLGRAFQQRIQIVAAVSAGAEFAFLAEQNGTAGATIVTETKAVVVSASNSLLATSDITVTVNDGNPWSDRCCVSGGGGAAVTWTCGSAGSITSCADGSSPGVYVEISATHQFTPFFSADVTLTGTVLSSDIVARVQ
jgi:Flp pilus assembly protein TadG